MRSGARTPPEVPEPREKDHINDFASEQAEEQADGGVAAEEFGDVVVADAEAAGEEDAADSDADAADRGPPHPMDLEVAEEVFEAVHDAAEQSRGEADEKADSEGDDGDGGGLGVGQRGHAEERAGAEPEDAHDGGGDAGEGDRDEAAGTPLEEQELDGEEDGCERRGEGGGHAGGGSGYEQGGAFGVGEVHPLGYERAEGSAGHDDGAFRTEGASGADGDGGGDGLENGDLGVDAGAVEEDGFDGFGDAVAADLLGAVARHDADEYATDYRDERHPVTERAVCWPDGGEAEAVEVEDVGGEGDALEEQDGEEGCAGADDDGDAGEQPDAAVDGEVAEDGRVGVHWGLRWAGAVFCRSSMFLRERMRRGPSSRSSRAWYSERVSGGSCGLFW